jgi:hypothetical protein
MSAFSDAVPAPAPRLDRLYELIPAILRTRDAEQGYPLRDLLRVIAEQVSVVEDDITALYDNWFIETAADWVVPYTGDLVGYRPVSEAGDPSSASPAEVRVLVPRREVANEIHAHRRKGTLALLEELAQDVAGWPARAVEFARLLDMFAHLNHQHPHRGRVVDLHDIDAIELLDGPYDRLAHTVDVRRIDSAHRPGRYNIAEVGLFVWRLRTYPATWAPATCVEEVSPSSFAFSVLGNDAPLFSHARLPVPLRRRTLAAHLATLYGPAGSIDIEVGVRRGKGVQRQPVPVEQLVVADLTDWAYRPRRGTVAIDPVLGRLALPPGHPPVGVWVCYRYGFSADIGGGEYPRRIAAAAPGTFYQAVSRTRPQPAGVVGSIKHALDNWQNVRAEQPTATIEILDNEVYSEPLVVTLYHGESLQIRAADRARPVIYLLDRKRNAPDALSISTPNPTDHDRSDDEEPSEQRRSGGCVRLDGLTITGRAVHFEGPLQRIEIRDCTLVPGWGLQSDCEPSRPSEPSLELYACTAHVSIDRSILGSIQVYADEVTSDPICIHIADTIIDATSTDREAIGAPNWPLAHATVSFSNCTVFGTVQTHAVLAAQNTIFTGCVRVARRQLGCIRYSYVPPGSRTPRRHNCQPDLVGTADQWRVVPKFTSMRYGRPAYAQLARECAVEIVRGAADESEMGAFHDLFQPQRLANLAARLAQFTPARTDTAVLIAD